MSQKKQITYQAAGVNIDAGDQLIDTIAPHVKKTVRPEVVSHLGGYAGLFALDLKKFKEPLIVSTTDGVGTKLKIAFEMEKFDTVGDDLVAMCVNDLICCGAEPLFFLDYYATGKLDGAIAKQVIAGIAKALAPINCTLIGGETAEMPGFYRAGEFDLAGFAVGAVNKSEVIDGQKTQIGDSVIGVASSGVHSNGFSLVRKIISERNLDLYKKYPPFDKPLGEVLLTPTKIYVNPVLQLIRSFEIRGIAHITGGGLVENIPRILPESCCARLEKQKIKTPPIFSFLQQQGNVPDTEMWRVFNRGIGLVLVVKPSVETKMIKSLEEMGCPAARIGEIVETGPDKKQVQLV